MDPIHELYVKTEEKVPKEDVNFVPFPRGRKDVHRAYETIFLDSLKYVSKFVPTSFHVVS